MESTTTNLKSTLRYIPDSGDFAEEGKYYEQKVTAFVSLEALNNVEDFCLISNPPNCAPFDDIILYARINGRNAMYLFQVKSKLHPTTITDDEIKLEHFPSINNNKKKRKNNSKFQIDALYKRFPEAIKEIRNLTPEMYINEDTKVKVIIFTNRPVQHDSEILELIHPTNFCVSQGKSYKFKSDFIKTFAEEKLDFLESILLYAEQGDSDIDSTSIRHIKRYFNSEDDVVEAIKFEYFNCVKNWCEMKGEKDGLTKQFVDKLFMYSTFKNYAVPIEDYDEGAFRKHQAILAEECFNLLWESIKKNNLSVSFELKNYMLGKALEDFQSLHIEAKEYKQIICSDELKRTNKKKQLEYYIGFLMGEMPLIVQDFNLALKGELEFLKVVSITRECQRNWLKINANVRNEIKRLTVTTSSHQSFKVEDIIHGISGEASISDVLNLVINSRNKKSNGEILLHRSLNRILLDKATFLNESRNEVFIVNTNGIKAEFISWSGINENNVLAVKDHIEILRFLESGEYKYILIDQDVNIETPKSVNVHFLKVIYQDSRNKKDKEVEWIKTNGNVEHIKKFRTNSLCKKIQKEINGKVLFDEDCFCCIKLEEIKNPFTIISGVPGVGKTTILRQFAETAPANDYILFVALIDHYDYYDNYKSASAEQHLMYFYKSESSILNDYFANKMSTKNITVLFDAFDEIAPKYTEIVSEIIKKIRAANYKVILTTRSVLKNKVEDLFGTFSFTLNLFYEQDIQNYLEAYYKLNAGNLPSDFTEIVKKNMPGDVEFCKVPVNLHLITEVISNELKEYPGAAYKLNKLQLYERFINYRIGIYSQKIKNTNISETSILTYHKYFSINLLFSKESIYKDIQNFIDIQLHRYIMDIKEGTEKVGILIDDINEIIIHRTVAEYLTASWLVEISNPATTCFEVERKFAEVIIRKIIFSRKYSIENEDDPNLNAALSNYNYTIDNNYDDDAFFPVVGLFFDLMINKNYFHKAALEGNYKIIGETHLIPLNDFNRTILHTLLSQNATFYNEKSLKIHQDLIQVVNSLITNCSKMLTHKDNSQMSAQDYVEQKKLNRPLLIILIHKIDKRYIYFNRDFELWEIFCTQNLHNCDIFQLLEALHGVEKLSTIFEAAANGHLKVIQEFYGAGVNIDISNYIFPCFDKHLLHFAAENGSLAIIKFLSQNGISEKLQIMDQMLRSIAHYSVLSGNIELISYLHEKKVDYTSYDFDGFSAFHYAAIFDKIEVVKYFLNEGVDINLPTKYFNYTPLGLAATFCNKKLFELFLEKGADMPNKVIYGDTLLHCMTSVISRVKRFSSHMETKFTLEEYDKRCFDFITHLLKKGPDINARTKTITPLINSAFEGNETLVKFLIENSADINASNDYGCTVLHAAAYNCNIPTLKLLLQYQIDINSVDINNNSALHYALEKHDCYETVVFLIKNGTNPRAPNDLGITPLHIAAYGRDLNELRLFVELNNININARNNEGDTPLHYAVFKDKFEIVEYLIEKRADVNLANNRNQTPLDFAIVFEHKRIELFLKSHNGISKENALKNEPKYMSHLNGRFTTKNRRILRYILQFYTQNSKIS